MTTVVRWNPIRDMAAMQGAFDRLFEENRRGVRANVNANSLPLDVHETEQAYIIHAVVPGINADAVNISLHDDVLTIAGEVPQFSLENSKALLIERNYGKFQRSLRLPQTVDVSAVEAQIENGVLTLTLPKSPEAQPRVIPVKAGNSFSNN